MRLKLWLATVLVVAGLPSAVADAARHNLNLAGPLEDGGAYVAGPFSRHLDFTLSVVSDVGAFARFSNDGLPNGPIEGLTLTISDLTGGSLPIVVVGPVEMTATWHGVLGPGEYRASVSGSAESPGEYRIELGVVPEGSGWSMMLAGIGIVLFIILRGRTPPRGFGA